MVSAMFSLTKPMLQPQNQALAEVSYSLANRHPNPFVNEVFSDNILLAVAYMGGSVKNKQSISWEAIRKTNNNQVILLPGQTFAFHDSVFNKYENQIASTTNAHFSSYEGFRFSGYLVGDGVCHLASFMKVVAQKAGLTVEAPVRHDFAAIPEIDKIDGVSIFYTPYDQANSSRQNLYITNNQDKAVAFVFSTENSILNIKVEQLN